VALTHIRRHDDARWPGHDQSCDFYKDQAEQRSIVASYGPGAGRPFRLVRKLKQGGGALERTIETRSYSRGRPGLARLLMRLMEDAGLQRIPADWTLPALQLQIKAIWGAASHVELDTKVKVSDFFCTSPARLGELIERLINVRVGRFKHNRAHGILLARVGAITKGIIEPLAGAPIAVRGRIAVFGEDGEGTNAKAKMARAPYLAACIVGNAEDEGRVEVLSAYVHPCMSAKHLMLVDSNFERQTFRELQAIQAEVANKKKNAVTIVKPLFDLGAAAVPDDNSEGRPPAIPDFILTAEGPARLKKTTVIVETMGYTDQDYNLRKVRTQRMMSSMLDGAPVIEHDMRYSFGTRTKEESNRFRREVIAKFTE
jgi:hypothetical protein